MELNACCAQMVNFGMDIDARDAEEVKYGVESIWVVNAEEVINGMEIDV